MKQRVDFKAYDKRGDLQLATWANAPVSIQMEGEVYQRRLNRGDFLYVEVSSSDPHFRNFTMHPGRAEHVWNIGHTESGNG